ncbi:hypothetical protein Emin_0958 [Elusimicrobium minutum Pei191]|uniref:Terminase small subunit n=1 Tax=Elusimicrobium minutum (strain Pei191) TaxID=445932 RepID=B2KDB5_ELUMP|nr:hypothetical protein [Elusimicrobium minutum]ACC98511.1 hypothetical protein Emin_0958 [Elusimicrobium minutum Pei191]
MKKKKKTAKKGTRRVGRPSLLDDEASVRQLEYAFSIGCNAVQACVFAKVSRDSFYLALKKDREFSDRIDKLKQNPVLKAKQTVFNDLGNPQTARWYLEKKAADEFGNRQSLTVDATVESKNVLDEETILKIMAEKKAKMKNEKKSAKGSAK